MRRGKQKTYDDDALVLAIARGDKSYIQIAKEFGLSNQMVSAVARGICRPELLPRIQELERAFRDQARRLAMRMATGAIARLGKLIHPDLEPTPEVQRKAAVDILKYALGDPSRPQVSVFQAQQTQGFPVKAEHAAEFYRWRARKAGWEDTDASDNRPESAEVDEDLPPGPTPEPQADG